MKIFAKIPPRWRWTARILFTAALMAGIWGVLYLNGSSFEDKVRTKVVAELERVTGAEVEIRTFKLHPFLLSAQAEGLTLREKDAKPGEFLFSVDRIDVQLKVLSFFDRQLGLRGLTLEHPVLRLHTRPDGTLNFPLAPGVATAPSTGAPVSPVEPLFEIALDQFIVHDGTFEFNGRVIPMDFSAQHVDASLEHASAHDEFFGKLGAESGFSFLHGATLRGRFDTNFRFDRVSASFNGFRWASKHSQIEADGKITDLRAPKLEMEFKAKTAVDDAAAFLQLPKVYGGDAEFKGHAEVSAGVLRINSSALAHGLGWRDSNIRMYASEVSAQLAIDQNDFIVNKLFARVAGGTVNGEMKISDWLTSRTDPNAKPQTGKVDLKVNALNAGEAFADISQSWMPLDKLHAAGSVEGTAAIDWHGAITNAILHFALEVTPPIQPQEKQLPIEATLRGSLDPKKQLLQADLFRVRTPKSQFTATGPLGPGATEMHLEADSTDLGEWQPLLTGDKAFPIVLRDRVSFIGSVRGTLAAPEFAGDVQSGAFNALVENRIWPFDSFIGLVEYSTNAARVRNGVLLRGKDALRFTGGAELAKWALTNGSSFSVDVDSDGVTADEVQSFTLTNYPVAGSFRGHVNISGTLDDFRGAGDFSMGSGSYFSEPVISAKAGIGFRASSDSVTAFELRDIAVTHAGGVLTGRGSYDRSTGALRYEVATQDFDLSRITRLKNNRFPFEGRARLDFHGAGTWEHPVLNATMNVQNMKLNGEWLGDLDAQAQTRAGELKLNASSKLIYARLTAEGKVEMTGDLPAKIDVHCTGFNMDPLVRAFSNGKLKGTSSVNGNFTITGPMRDLKSLKMTGTVDQLQAEIEGVKLVNAGPLNFSADGREVKIESFHVTGQDTDFSAHGELAWSAAGPLNVRAEGLVNLKLFQGFNSDLRSSGTVKISAHVSGSRNDPQMSGNIQVQDASESFIDAPNGLTNMNGEMVFNEDRLEVRSLTAKSGGGTIKIGGYITYHNELYFDLTGEGREIRFRYPPGVSSAADADLRFVGTTRSSLLSGTITITRLGVNPHFDFAQYLTPNKPSSTGSGLSMPAGVPQGALENLRLDVRIVSAADLRVATSLAKVSGTADIRLRGTAARPAVLGRVNIAEGEVYFNGTQYRLERGDIQFTNPVKTEISLNLEASARVRDYDITVGFHGPMDRLSTSYRSEPPLPGGDIIALLALGRTREDAVLYNQPSSSINSADSDAVLGEALNATLSSRVQKLFGVSRIKIDPQVGGPENNPNARITIEQQVKNNVTLTFISNLSQSAQQIIQLEYAVNPDLSIIAVRDQNGVLGFDVRVRKRRK